MNRWLIVLFIIITVICIAIGHAIYKYYTSPTDRETYIIPRHHDDTLRIAYIGDSWAAMHKEHECIIVRIIEDSIHRPVKVSSFGIHGKTSKEIYENLFDNQNMRHFMMQGYDFCFVSAGINDTYKKMSVTYYRTSMNYIIRFMLTNHIHPIILDIPDYDIVKSYDRQQYVRKLLRKISMVITGSQMDCKQRFRNTLAELVTSFKESNQISILNYQEWNNDYYNDIKKYYLGDGMHLNKLGYAKLDSCIAKHIIQQIY
jgi:lysophospholipase L1-like esterase